MFHPSESLFLIIDEFSCRYLLGSGGTLVFDVTIVAQSFIYKSKHSWRNSRSRSKFVNLENGGDISEDVMESERTRLLAGNAQTKHRQPASLNSTSAEIAQEVISTGEGDFGMTRERPIPPPWVIDHRLMGMIINPHRCEICVWYPSSLALLSWPLPTQYPCLSCCRQSMSLPYAIILIMCTRNLLLIIVLCFNSIRVYYLSEDEGYRASWGIRIYTTA